MYNYIKHPINKKIYNLDSKIGKKILRSYIFYLNGGSNNENPPHTLSDDPSAINYTPDDLLFVLLNSRKDFKLWADGVREEDLIDKHHNRFILLDDKYKDFKNSLGIKNIHYNGDIDPWKKRSSPINNSNILDYSNYVLIPQLNFFYKFIFKKGCLYNSKILQNKYFQRVLKIATVFKMLIDYCDSIIEFKVENEYIKIATDIITFLSILLGGVMNHGKKQKNLLEPQPFNWNEDFSYNFYFVQLPIYKEIVVLPFLYTTIINVFKYDTPVNENLNLNLFFFLEDLKKLPDTDIRRKYMDLNNYHNLIENIKILGNKYNCPLAVYAENIIEDFMGNNLIFHLPVAQPNIIDIEFKINFQGKSTIKSVDLNSYIGLIKKNDIKDIIKEIHPEEELHLEKLLEIDLVCNGKILKNYQTLSENNIKKNSKIYIIRKPSKD